MCVCVWVYTILFYFFPFLFTTTTTTAIYSFISPGSTLLHYYSSLNIYTLICASSWRPFEPLPVPDIYIRFFFFRLLFIWSYFFSYPPPPPQLPCFYFVYFFSLLYSICAISAFVFFKLVSYRWNSFIKCEQIFCLLFLFFYFSRYEQWREGRKRRRRRRLHFPVFSCFDERVFFERDCCDFWQVSVYSGNQSCPSGSSLAAPPLPQFSNSWIIIIFLFFFFYFYTIFFVVVCVLRRLDDLMAWWKGRNLLLFLSALFFCCCRFFSFSPFPYFLEGKFCIFIFWLRILIIFRRTAHHI